jgi:hypothetical protein
MRIIRTLNKGREEIYLKENIIMKCISKRRQNAVNAHPEHILA